MRILKCGLMFVGAIAIVFGAMVIVGNIASELYDLKLKHDLEVQRRKSSSS